MSTNDVPNHAIHAGGSEEATVAAYSRCIAVLLRTGIWIVDPPLDGLPQEGAEEPRTQPGPS